MSKRKLLLADDSVTIQKVVNLTFADEGIEVISVSDGDSAISKILETSPDLVMLDVNMPGLNGYEICEQLRKSEQFRKLPVILLVGSFEPFDEDEARRVGANDYLTKPFQSIRQLVTTVTNLLSAIEISDEPAFDDTILETTSADMPSVSSSSMEPAVENIEPHADPAIEYSSLSSAGASEDVEIAQTENSESDVPDYSDIEKEISATENYDVVENDHLVSPFEDQRELSSEKRTHSEIPAIESYREVDTLPVPDAQIEDLNAVDVPMISEADSEATISETEQISENSSAGIETEFGNNFRSEVPTEEFKFDSSENEFGDIKYDTGDILEEDSPIADNNMRPIADEPASENFPYPEAASILELDEDNLLEIAPREEDFLVNIDEDDDFDSEIRFDDSVFGENAFDSTPESALPITIPKEVKYDLDDATINEIVNRVISKLSDSVVREVAWEVVPPKADLMIKQIIEEKLENS